MGERDAFGREKDEDPLGGMGWSTPSTSARRTEPPVTVSRDSLPGMGADVNHDGIPGTHGPPPRTFPEHRGLPNVPRARRRGGFGIVRLLRGLVTFGVVIFILGGVLLGAIGAIVDSADDVEISRPSFPETPALDPGADDEETERPADTEESPATPPQGLQAGSMLLAKNFAAVKTSWRTGRYGKLKNFSIRPDRINAQFVTRDGRLRNMQFSPGGKSEVFSTSGPGFSTARTLTVKPINTAAPFRLVRSAAGRLGRGATSVDYVVYFGEDFVGEIVWGVFFKDGKAFQADTRGKIIRQIQ